MPFLFMSILFRIKPFYLERYYKYSSLCPGLKYKQSEHFPRESWEKTTHGNYLAYWKRVIYCLCAVRTPLRGRVGQREKWCGFIKYTPLENFPEVWGRNEFSLVGGTPREKSLIVLSFCVTLNNRRVPPLNNWILKSCLRDSMRNKLKMNPPFHHIITYWWCFVLFILCVIGYWSYSHFILLIKWNSSRFFSY